MCKNKAQKIVIGIDQSYTRTGITVLCDGNIIKMVSVDYDNCKTNTDKRGYLRKKICEIVYEIAWDYHIDGSDRKVIVERIRTFSGGHMSQNYIKSTGALVSVIIDLFSMWDIPVYSVDTRAWKRAIVGTDKPQRNKHGINPNKYPTILYMRDKGLLKYIAEEYEGKGKKGVIWANKGGQKIRCKINDDLADSYCIAMYGFLPEKEQKLQREEF